MAGYNGMQGFENSPQALLLVATRCMLDSAALCEHAKKEALESGILNQLKSVACENLAVLTGRRAGDFTDRTNSCMWYVFTPLSDGSILLIIMAHIRMLCIVLQHILSIQ